MAQSTRTLGRRSLTHRAMPSVCSMWSDLVLCHPQRCESP